MSAGAEPVGALRVTLSKDLHVRMQLPVHVLQADKAAQVLEQRATRDHNVWGVIRFVAWRFESEGNLSSTIPEKTHGCATLHRLEALVELDLSSPMLKCALRGIVRNHDALAAACRVGLPVSWRMLGDGKNS